MGAGGVGSVPTLRWRKCGGGVGETRCHDARILEIAVLVVPFCGLAAAGVSGRPAAVGLTKASDIRLTQNSR